MYKSQFRKIDRYDWSCGPESQMRWLSLNKYSAAVFVLKLSQTQFKDNCSNGDNFLTISLIKIITSFSVQDGQLMNHD